MSTQKDPDSGPPSVTIIGGGLAGCEAAWQAATLGCRVSLFEMKPSSFSAAHKSPLLAELVCSNSFRSDASNSAVGLLKEEMRRLGSLLMRQAELYRVPAGQALAVDREQFATSITDIIRNHPLITVVNEEVTTIPKICENESSAPLVLATGPLTSADLANSLARLTGKEHLAFFDAIAPIIDTESLDMNIVFRASRYDDGPGDYLNCPMDKEQYLTFIQAMKDAEKVQFKSFEKPKYFEGCLPVEVMLERGDDTLRFGPMKPVGLPDPRTGKDTHAIVQLRFENAEGSTVNMVGFQTKLTYPAQKKVFSLIPGLENADFIRMGSLHRNTFIRAPEVLNSFLQFTKRPSLFLAGQLTGVEGYVESTAMGLLAGINAARQALGQTLCSPPESTAHGSLIRHLTQTEAKRFQPSNINFGLFPKLTKKMPKRFRGEYRAEQALAALSTWQQANNIAYGSD